MLLSNQIARFFDHQYLWKESSDILDFVTGDIHYRKVVTVTTTFGWVWPGRPSHAQTCQDLVDCL